VENGVWGLTATYGLLGTTIAHHRRDGATSAHIVGVCGGNACHRTRGRCSGPHEPPVEEARARIGQGNDDILNFPIRADHDTEACVWNHTSPATTTAGVGWFEGRPFGGLSTGRYSRGTRSIQDIDQRLLQARRAGRHWLVRYRGTGATRHGQSDGQWWRSTIHR